MKNNVVRIIKVTRSFLAGCALAACLASFVIGRHARAAESTKALPVALTVSESATPHQGNLPYSFAPVIKKVAASVVRVDVVVKSRLGGMQGTPDMDEDLLRRWFGEQGRGGRSKGPKPRGLGSGVIINKNGYIITNNHVVEEAEEIHVTLNDGREFEAKIIGRDPNTDVAVIKVDAKDLPVVAVSDSDKIEVGDVCLAIGNPFGIGQTVTMGIVSAISRGGLYDLGTEYEDYIQTDAAINPGNSGGALVDAQGNLIGINTAILSRSGGYQGVGFAIPINMATSVMNSLIDHGKVIRGSIGVHIGDLTTAMAAKFSLSDNHGALVEDVVPRSPAEKAGIQAGDVIVEFNGKPISDSRRLKLVVAQSAPGTTAPVKIVRDGRGKELSITVKERDPEDASKSGDPKDSKNDSADVLNGVTVEDIDAQARGRLNLPSNIKGALVSQVEEDSAAYDQGLRPGDVIQEINKQKVNSADDAVRLTSNVKDKVVLLRVYSKGVSHFMVVDESKSK